MRHLIAALAISLVYPTVAQGQAWVDDKGSLSAGATYNYTDTDCIIYNNGDCGENFELVSTRYHSVALGVAYVPIDKLQVSASLPYFWIKSRPRGTTFNGIYDDDNYHGTLTDLRLDARYAVLAEPLAITPNLGVTTPVTNYEVFGNGGANRHLNQLHVGLTLGYFATKGVPGLFAQGSYEYTISERFKTDFDYTSDINQNYHSISAQAGYNFLEKFTVWLGTDIRLAQDGIQFDDFTNPDSDLPLEARIFYNPLLKQNVYMFGGGFAYQINEKLNLSALFSKFVTGDNTGDPITYGLAFDYGIL